MPLLRRPFRGPVTTNVIRDSTVMGLVMQASVINIQGPLPAVKVPVQLRPPVHGFAGRVRQLDEVEAFLNPASEAGPVMCVITGPAGAGKTELALQGSQTASARGWFPGGVIFIDMHGYDETPLSAAQALDWALQALGVAAENVPSTAEQRAALYRSEMAAALGAVLVVADSAADLDQVKPLVAAGTRHRVLVTSRHEMSQRDARLIELPVLDDAEAVDLLEEAIRLARPGDSRVTDDRPSAIRLAGYCGHLPLALQIAAALLKRDPGKPVAELAGELADESSRLRRLDDNHRAVLPVFDLSYRQLDPQARRLFRLLTVNPGPDLATQAAAVLGDVPREDVRPILDGLADAHIIERLAVRDRWRMHDLVRVYARQRAAESAASDGRDMARDRLGDYYRNEADEAYRCLVTDAGDDDHADGRGASQGERPPRTPRFPDRAAAATWLETERGNLVAATADSLAAGEYATSLDLAQSLSPYLDARLHMDDLLIVAEAGIAAAQSLGQRAAEAQMLIGRSKALRLARCFDRAIAACQMAITISQDAGDRRSECQVMASLGAALAEVGRLEEALTACERAGEIAGGEGAAADEGIALSNQGLVLVQLNRPVEALPLCRRACELLRGQGIFGMACAALNNLAIALIYLDQPAEAVTACRDALAIAEETGNLDYQAVSLSNLADALALTGRVKQALEESRRAVDLCRSTHNRHREGTALLSMANASNGMRQYEEALTAGNLAVSIFQDVADARLEGRALRVVALSLRRLKRPGEAAARLSDAVAKARSVTDDLGAGYILDDLADICYSRRRFRDAAVAYLRAASLLWNAGAARACDRALDRLTAVLKKLRRWTPDEILRGADGYPPDRFTMVDLGYALDWIGRPAQAVAMHQEAVDLSRADDDPSAEAMALAALGRSLSSLKRTEEGVQTCREAIAVAQVAGLRREEASAWSGLARSLGDAGQADEAVAAWRSGAAIWQELGVPYSLAGALTGLGMALADSCAEEEAVTTLRQAVDLYAGIGGDGARAKMALAICLIRCGRAVEAVPLFGDIGQAFVDRGEFRQLMTAANILAIARSWWPTIMLIRRARRAARRQ